MTQRQPHTVGSLAADLRRLGLTDGDVVIVHSSVRAIGFVAGMAQAVVQALIDVVGAEAGAGAGGTVVVPTHTSFNSDPAGWRNPPVPAEWWPVIREQSPGFDPRRTPSWWVGVLPEIVRSWPGALRSSHPEVSFAALGAKAAEVVADHRLDDGLGEASPLGAIYRERGKVLLIGCGHDRNTSLHLAEFRQPNPPLTEFGAAVRRPDGSARWITWIAPDTDTSDFSEIGKAFEATGAVSIGPVGDAEARLMPQAGLVDFATEWMRTHRR
ncbi:aminoglycoside N(3)-acetyltransferase [Actinoplanes sp. CA-030573]|uniref:aminoglycoside N(3)-acetyltransferase n=1 Tax=Actinoplanes sp. CA-030573 TaxID=3239898 RepID=UPI003D934180